ncbi:serine/threonine-protein kinase [Nocardia asteroides]|uniref:serine/threonine-protein kinase n=1 Tax=Nocardia asteroides TaxID=1824 RepID=UPI001E3298BF|nr:serine/threonine-protein kinase [Nocardia asteroides]UGT63538.1 serine/threonine protein kinase [Nocardia asteroides]
MVLRPGEIFAGYRVLRPLGAGGMGAVYLAQHPRLPRRDALKVLDPGLGADPEFRARFEREADLAARLEHPNVVAVYDRGAEGETLWIAMRYVDGVDAAELIRRGPAELPPARAVRIVAAAARGLDAAHRNDLLHRDVKPANIMVAVDDEGNDVVRLTDFGIARPLDAPTSLTVTGSVLATFAYAAPELLTGGPVDRRADVYSLGCTLFELLTGGKPFGSRQPAAAMAAHLFEPPPRASALNPALPPALDAVIAKAMAKEPGERFASCGALAEAAVAALGPAGADGVPPSGVSMSSGFSAAGPEGSTGSPLAYRAGSAAGSGRPAPGPPAAGAPTGPPPGGAFVSGPQQAPGSAPGRRSRWPVAAGALVLLGILAATTLVVFTRSDPTGTATPATTTATTVPPTSRQPTTTAPPTSAWGSAAYIAGAFPGLVPADPEGTGYLGMRCALNDDRGAWLHCPAETDDGFNVNIRCDPTRRPVTYTRAGSGYAALHEERWTRPSGTGSLRYATDTTGGYGLLDIAFDDPARSFCTVGASGGRGGRDVYDRWFAGAPL